MIQQCLSFDEPQLVREFRQFDRANPEVYELFCKFTYEAIKKDRRPIGAKLIYERIRWYERVDTTDVNFKLPNNYHAFYARKFVQNHPEWDWVFKLCKSQADGYAL